MIKQKQLKKSLIDKILKFKVYIIALLLVLLSFASVGAYLNTFYVDALDKKVEINKVIQEYVDRGYVLDEGKKKEIKSKSNKIKFTSKSLNQDYNSYTKNLKDYIKEDFDKQQEPYINQVKERILALDSELKQNELIEYPEVTKYIKLVSSTENSIENSQISVLNYKEHLDNIEKNYKEYKVGLDNFQKERLVENLIDLNKQEKELTEFFNKYYAYSSQKNNLSKYRELTEDLKGSERYKNSSFQELKTFLEDEVYHLVQDVQKFRDTFDSKKADQKQK